MTERDELQRCIDELRLELAAQTIVLAELLSHVAGRRPASELRESLLHRAEDMRKGEASWAAKAMAAVAEHIEILADCAHAPDQSELFIDSAGHG